MSRVHYLLCAVVVILVAVENSSAHGYGPGRGYGRGHGHGGGGRHHHHHGRGHHHYNPIHVSVTIYDPKGFEVYVRRPNDSAQYFAFEMDINEQDSGSPDVSLNTSDVVYGKYILRDTEVVIKPGDLLNITWSMGLSNGSALAGNRLLTVFGRMIVRNCSCEDAASLPVTTSRSPISSIPPWSRPTTPTFRPTTTTFRPTRPARPDTTTERFTTASSNLELEDSDYSVDYSEHFDCEIDPSTNLCQSSLMDVRLAGQPQKLVARATRDDELNALKAIIGTLSQQCPRKPKSNLLTLASPQYSVDSSVDWLKYVRRTLGESPKLKTLATHAVRSARPNGHVIVFEMETLLDKLMMLHLCQEAGVSSVKDYD